MSPIEPDRHSYGMTLSAALEVLHRVRTDQIVITTMGAARHWPRLSRHPLDFHYIPSAMGQAPLVGLGLALAQPWREVIVLNGDGCQLMNLGSLVTIAASGARNLTLIVLDNGHYEVTGGQQTAAGALRSASGAGVDFAALARAAGWPTAEPYQELSDWQAAASQLMTRPGPRFVALAVQGVGDDYHLVPPGPMGPRLRAFREALGTSAEPIA